MSLPPQDLLIGLHGTLELAPWARRAIERDGLAEDAHSLVAKRLEALGADGADWDHVEAGEDWRPGPGVRQLAWSHAVVDAGLPVAPLVAALDASLRRVGRPSLTGVHGIVPLHLAAGESGSWRAGGAWFASGDPDARVELNVLVDTGPSSEARDGADAAIEAITALLGDVMPVRHADPRAFAWDRFGPDPVGARPNPAHSSSLSCTAPEWSAELAGWVVAVVAGAYAGHRSTASALVAVAPARTA